MEKRERIEDEYKWDFQQIYSSEDEWREDAEKVRKDLEKIREFSGSLMGSPDSLYQVLELRENILQRLDKVSSYARMRKDIEMSNNQYQKFNSVAESLRAETSYKLSFIAPEIVSEREKALNFLEESSDLEKFEHYVDRLLKLEDHYRSREVEEVVAKMREILNAPQSSYSMLLNADIEFPEVKRDGKKTRITLSNFTKLLKDKDPEFREEVYNSFYDCLDSYRNTISSDFQANLKKNQRIAEIKNYENARQASLKSSHISTEIYDTLVETVENNLQPLHNHIKLKESKIDGEIRMSDLYRSMEGEDHEISYSKAKKIVLEALKPLGKEYVETVEKGLNSDRWVDVYETENKRSGAYSGGAYGTRPYVLMNYKKDLNSLYTLAHEIGHSMHSHYTNENQPYTYSNYGIFAAEVASTVNEMLLTEYLLNSEEFDDLNKEVLAHQLENIRNTFYRQTMFASFEKKAHEKVEGEGAITSDEADKLYNELKYTYYEGVKKDEKIKKEWMRIPHFYYNFYVFQYATGISAAKKLSERILETEEGRKAYIKFLKSGSSDYPTELLKDAGADLEDTEIFENLIEYYSTLQEEYRELELG